MQTLTHGLIPSIPGISLPCSPLPLNHIPLFSPAPHTRTNGSAPHLENAVTYCIRFLIISLFFFACTSSSAFALSESFESGQLKTNWSTFGQKKFSITSDEAASGSYSVMVQSDTGEETADSYHAFSTLQTRMNTKEDGQISFQFMTTVHQNSFALNFYIDNEQVAHILPWDYTVNTWHEVSYDLAKGEHILRWEYTDSEDSYVGNIYLDDIQASEEDLRLYNDVEYDDTCSLTMNHIWLGNYLGALDGLTKNDVTVAINGTPVSDFTFKTVTPDPLNGAVVMDYSESVFLKHRRAVESAAVEWMTAMSDTDKSSLTKFGDEIDQVVPLTNDKDTLWDGVDAGESMGLTYLYDGAMAGISSLSDADEGNKALIIYTDGLESDLADGSTSTLSEVISAAKKNDISVHTIGIGENIDTDVLQRMATKTGGSYHYIESTSYLAEAYGEIKGMLSSNYLIILDNSLYPELKKSGATITVTVTLSDGSVISKTVTSGCSTNLLLLVLPAILHAAHQQ